MEMYWLADAPAGFPIARDELRGQLEALATSLRDDLPRRIPAEPGLELGSRWRRKLKRLLFGLLRPLSRRSDRNTANVASMTAALVDRLRQAEVTIERLQAELTRLREDAAASPPRPAAAASPAKLEDYYWRYESVMRGSPESIGHRLRQYRQTADQLRALADEPPLWIDLGCGRGELMALVQEWGWRAEGVDASQKAVQACRAQGIQATQADIIDFVATYRGELPLAISAIQVIEHLPKESWLQLFEAVLRVLRPEGAFLVETINPMDPAALGGSFFGDVTHTWPAHPETLRVTALHAGFARADIVYLNPDERGSARDYALWAWAR